MTCMISARSRHDLGAIPVLTSSPSKLVACVCEARRSMADLGASTRHIPELHARDVVSRGGVPVDSIDVLARIEQPSHHVHVSLTARDEQRGLARVHRPAQRAVLCARTHILRAILT